jgi:YegS/Rv2252/BmrU family lipid kinase
MAAAVTLSGDFEQAKRIPSCKSAMIARCAGRHFELIGRAVQVKPAMRRVALIYNPASGQYSSRRKAAVGEIKAVLSQAGVDSEAFETGAPGSATTIAEQAVKDGFDTVLACGGDGTVHEAVQSLVGTDVALGVVPLGTANALAADLGLIASPAKVARTLLTAAPSRVSVGRIYFADAAGNPDSRYFVVAAGVGADALLMSRLDSRLKRRLGYVLYLIEAFRIWATSSFPLFEAELPLNGNGGGRVVEVSQLLAVRVRSFGGVLRTLAPGASLRNGSLSMLAFKTQSRLQYLSFLLAVVAGRHTFNRSVELMDSPSIVCRACDGIADPLFVEADGEVLGRLPVRLEVVPHSLTLLIPPGVEP